MLEVAPMMRVLLYMAAAALIWLLAGCNQDNGSENDSSSAAVTGDSEPVDATADALTTSESGGEMITEFSQNESTITLRGELPPDWPAELQLYPDATLGETSVTDMPEGKTFSALLKTSAEPSEVLRFHEQQTVNQNGHISESTIGPVKCIGSFNCATYSLNVTAQLNEGTTDITVGVAPPVADSVPLMSIRQLIEQDAVPEGFPSDLLPRYPGSNIVNSYSNGLGSHSIEMLTTDNIEVAADYYREHFAGLGWEEYSPIEKDYVRAYSFRGKGKLTLNVSSGGEGENHISISYEESK
jgi:hypothetical protein